MTNKMYTIEKDNCGLLVIDIQERFMVPFGDNTKKHLFRNAGIIIKTAKEFKLPVIITEQYSKGLGHTVPEIQKHLPDVVPYDKVHFNCMKDAAIARGIADMERRTIIVCGVETHICVVQTVLSLLDGKYSVIVASDAVASRSDHQWMMGLELMREAGALIYPAETISFMLLEKSGTPEFKRLSPVFKQA